MIMLFFRSRQKRTSYMIFINLLLHLIMTSYFIPVIILNFKRKVSIK